MAAIDADLLGELGLEQLPSWEQDLLLEHITKTLEIRVGIALANGFSDDQLDEFEVFVSKGDEQAALVWLEENFPEYKKVVGGELAKLKDELSRQVSSILEISRGDQVEGGGDGTEPSDALMLLSGGRPGVRKEGTHRRG